MGSPRRILPVTLLLLCLLMLCDAGKAQAKTASAATTVAHSPLLRHPALPTLWIIGNGGVYPPAGGGSGTWVPWLTPLFDPRRINLSDRLDTGSTIRDNITNLRWAEVLSHVEPGDVVLIQFFFREAEPESVGGTGSLPGTGDELREVVSPGQPNAELVHTYGWYLREYVVETIARGATPILCSPAPTDPPEPNKGDATAWTRAIAIQQRIPFIDLSTYTQLASHPSGATSTTRAATVGSLIPEAIVASLKGMPSDPLAGYFSPEGDAIAPTRPPAPPQRPIVPPL